MIVVVAAAIAQDPPGKLPIDVPKGASVNFEAEGAGKQFITTIKALMNGGASDSDGSADKVTIKTSLGNFDLKLEDVQPLLDKIHWLHLVSYTDIPKDDPFRRYEKQFGADGLKRVAFAPGSDGVLITRQIAETDRYGIVVRQKGNVLVLRTEGAPGLGDFGRVLFEAVSHAVQKAIVQRKHGE